MNNDIIKNREGRIVGRFTGDWLADRSGKLIARYVSSTDTTITREGRIVGTGDQRLLELGKKRRQQNGIEH